jgi:23S rRNA pseudouridine2605 synthase
MASPKTKKTTTKKTVVKKTAAKKTVKSKKAAPLKPETTEPELALPLEAEVPKIEDPIGDETDGEAETTVEQATEKLETESVLYQGTTSVVPHEQLIGDRALAPEGSVVPEGGGGFNPRIKPKKSARALAPEIRSETKAEAEDGSESEDEPKFTPQPRPPAKLERLQKILAAAGVASRRSAEAMIEQGRVEVNGKVVTVMGTKADAARDHIRVDGKLLQGPERHRYFVLNKPRGFVTTVKDPEHRPTVMQFFDKMKERLYPVGRLDYMSEGLLVVTNDGELANKLTKASSGVEKTYLVKVAGQPTEAELNILRGGVAIERGKPGSPQIRTSPARVRQVRQGDNPWYEVVLIEGRNRELRKMFEEIGHFVEKIRRVGYGPLVLDQEPGSLRELQPEELAALRRVAEGTLRTPKSKDLRRRNLLDAGLLPTVLPKPSNRPTWKKDDRPARLEDSFASGAANKLFRPARPSAEGFRPAVGRSFDRPPARPASRPAWKKDDRPVRPPARFTARSTGENRPAASRPFTPKPAWKKPERPARSTGEGFRPAAGRSFDRPPARPASRPAWKKDDRSARPEYKRPAAPRREAHAREVRVFDEDLGPVRPPNLHIEEITGPDRSSMTRSSSPRASSYRSSAPRPYSDRPRPSRPSFERPTSSSRPAAKPFRGEGGQSRPFTTSSGKPRAGGARPSSKSGPGWKPKSRFGPGKPASSSSRPFTPRTEGTSEFRPTKAKPYPNSASRAERKAGPGWKPKTRFGPGKPASGSHVRPKTSGSGPKYSGSRPFGKSGAPADRSSSVGWNRPGGKKRR